MIAYNVIISLMFIPFPEPNSTQSSAIVINDTTTYSAHNDIAPNISCSQIPELCRGLPNLSTTQSMAFFDVKNIQYILIQQTYYVKPLMSLACQMSLAIKKP